MVRGRPRRPAEGHGGDRNRLRSRGGVHSPETIASPYDIFLPSCPTTGAGLRSPPFSPVHFRHQHNPRRPSSSCLILILHGIRASIPATVILPTANPPCYRLRTVLAAGFDRSVSIPTRRPGREANGLGRGRSDLLGPPRPGREAGRSFL